MGADCFYLTASDGEKIAIHRWLPAQAPRACVMISHGMAEYAMRYDRFAEASVARGLAVFAQDHRGHGETAGSLSKLGYLADTDGFTRVMEDLHELTDEIDREYPNTPIILLGHSFGSFVAQWYIENYGDRIAGCVLSGTRGPNPGEVFGGRIVANLIALFCGRKKPSPFLTQLSFGSYNDRIVDPASPNSWLSRDANEVELYDATPWAGFTCTVGFFQDLTSGLARIHTKSALRGIPKDLPIRIICGSEDPVGGYVKTVSILEKRYADLGIRNLDLVVYEGGRHELLNEMNREEVTQGIFDWIDSAVIAAPESSSASERRATGDR